MPKISPSSNEIIKKVINPRDFEHPLLVGAAVSVGSLIMAGISVSGWLHRSTHGGVVYSEKAKKAFRAINWLTTGMPKRDWVTHLPHHAFPKRYDEAAHKEWNSNRPTGSPEAPMEAFRDTYSPQLEGYLRVFFKTPALHRSSKKALVPWLQKMHEFDQANRIEGRDHWPAPYRRVDMDEADPGAIRNRYPVAGLVLTGVVETLLLGPVVSVPAMSLHIGGVMTIGGDINATSHTGQEKGIINRVKVLMGLKEPVPDENGEFAANITEGYEGYSMGERHHRYHHDNPEDPYLAGTTLKRDPPGWIISKLVHLGLATTPGAPN